MKKIVCLIVLILALGSITFLTVYTLSNKGVKENVVDKVNRKIENVTSNITDSSLNEIYNVYLNDHRLKLKMEYNININKENSLVSGNLLVYIDGNRVILENVINNIKQENIKDVFGNSLVDNYVRIDMNNIEIIKENGQEYLLLKIGAVDKDKIKEKYYLFDDKGNSLIDEGLIIRDDNEIIINEDNSELNVFYDTLNGQVRVKRENNIFYVLELENEDNKMVLNEYKYYFKNKKLNKELIVTHEGVMVK